MLSEITLNMVQEQCGGLSMLREEAEENRSLSQVSRILLLLTHRFLIDAVKRRT
jgi:hypothetical protein